MEHSIDDVHTPNPDFDPTDPHGHGHGHHGHHIISARTLMTILLILLFFTVLTVALSRGEVWIQDTFHVILPQWLNVIIAMSIATVKAVLVCAYFMGLRFDKALNSIIMLICVAAVICFLFFTSIDLGNRGAVSQLRATVPTPGGTGYGLDRTYDGISTAASPRISTSGQPITEFRRNEKLAQLAMTEAAKHGRTEPNEADVAAGEAEFWRYYYNDYVKKGKHPHRHEHDEQNLFESLGFAHHDTNVIEPVDRPDLDAVSASSPNFSYRRTGITPHLLDDGSSHDAHGDAHAPSANESHDATPAETDPDH